MKIAIWTIGSIAAERRDILKKKAQLTLFSMLFIVWLLLSAKLSALYIIIGIILSFLITLLSNGIFYHDDDTYLHVPKLSILIKFTLILIKEIYVSSIKHTINILKKECDPIIVEVNLQVEDPLIITMISNAITLTPGTITVDAIGNKLYVLAMKDDGDSGVAIEKNIKNTFENIFLRM